MPIKPNVQKSVTVQMAFGSLAHLARNKPKPATEKEMHQGVLKAAAASYRELVREADVGWVEPQAKPIAQCIELMVFDGFRCALPILHGLPKPKNKEGKK